jgi:hypothetical protein
LAVVGRLLAAEEEAEEEEKEEGVSSQLRTQPTPAIASSHESQPSQHA